MNVEHTFFLAMKPSATARSRCACRGKYPTVYTEPKYAQWKAEAIEKLLEIARTEDFRDVAGRPVRVDLEVVASKPKTSKLEYPRGDRDNYEKGVFDAITQCGKWWKDDNQIIRGHFEKRWANPGEDEGYWLTIEFL
jgi:Holliday junction resolvase RusA-like endonuclease